MKKGERLILKLNGNGFIRTSQNGNICGYGNVRFNEKLMANILSFEFLITISTGPNDPCPTFCIHEKDGSVMEFKEHSLGLYVHDAASSNTTKDKILNEQVFNYSFLSTVAANEINYTSREIKRSQQALDFFAFWTKISSITQG